MKKAILLFLLSAAMNGVPKICQADPIEVEVGLQIFDPIVITGDGSSQAKRHSRALVIIFRPNNLAV